MTENVITKFRYAGFFLVVLLLLSVCACSEKPRLEIEPSVDVGVIKSSDSAIPLEISYDVHGSKSFRVKDIVPNCPCITMEIPDKPLSAHSSGKLRGELNMNGFPPQAIHKEIRVYVFEQSAPITIKINGTLVRD